MSTPQNHFALGIAYQGSAYHGWQYQGEQTATVQKHIQHALSIVADEPIQVTCAGRTDTGVHATKQVVNFSSTKPRTEKAWVMGTNAHLPDDISVNWAIPVDESFSARHSATARRYLYIVKSSKRRSALFNEFYTRDPRSLVWADMHLAAQHLLGENDFSSFRASNCQSNTPMRNVTHLNVTDKNGFVVIDIQANAFLHHMVRNIAGVLLDVGAGIQPTGWVKELLAARDRTLASVTAPPRGLYLVDVVYPGHPDIPSHPALPDFMSELI